MDWDSLEWRELPAAWMNKKAKRDFQRGATEVELDIHNTSGGAAEEEQAADPRVGEYQHPTRGMMHTYMFENTRNTRIYYDDKVNNWARMPLAWERNVDDVKAMLQEIDAVLPRWKNVNEQMLTLRECNYDLQDAIIFAEINWGYKPYEKDDPGKTKLERQLTRSGLVAGGEDEVDDLGVLSNAAQSKLYTLQKQLTAAEKKVGQLERLLDEKNNKKVRSLQRQNTQLDGELGIRDRRVQDMSGENQTLIRKVADIQQKWQDAERELLAVRADGGRVQALEAELTALKGGTEAAELQSKSSELERMRTENTHLKMKVVQMKAQLENPAGSRAALDTFRLLYKRVQAIQNEKNAARRDLDGLIETHSADLDTVNKAMSRLNDSAQERMKELQGKYRAEVLQRKQLYNKLQELKGNIRVFLRVRSDERGPNITQYPSDSEVILPDLRGEPVMLDFDHVYGTESKQADIFENVKPVILSCVDGYVLALPPPLHYLSAFFSPFSSRSK
jgi:kinesin family protein C2/C3